MLRTKYFFNAPNFLVNLIRYSFQPPIDFIIGSSLFVEWRVKIVAQLSARIRFDDDLVLVQVTNFVTRYRQSCQVFSATDKLAQCVGRGKETRGSFIIEFAE